MNLILWHVGHARVPSANELDILVDLIRLYFVQDNAVDVFSSGKNLTEAALDLLVVEEEEKRREADRRNPLCAHPRARAQYKEKGDESGLHIIIFDELDAICKQRGSTNNGTGVGDSVVNQLLSKVRPAAASAPLALAHTRTQY